MTEHFTAADGTRIAYEDTGDGLPVLALAGLTRNMRDFDFVAPHLGGVRLIRMDYRGRGQSDWPGPETYTLQHEGADALALLDHLGVERVGLLGTSRGGLIGMGLAALAPDRLLGLCLNDIGPDIAPEGLAAIMTYLGRPPVAKTLDEAAAQRAAFFEASGFAGVAPEVWRREAGHAFRETPEGLELTYDARLREAVAAMAGAPLPDLWPLFRAAAQKPLALIHGANSNILSTETVARMQSEAPAMRLAEVPDRGHVPFLDEPEALAVIHAWIGDMQV